MTNIKKVLLASAALAMFSGAAFAGENNKSYSEQQGEQNRTEIFQDQSKGSRIGSAGNGVLQNGTVNYLMIDQDGEDNQVGASDGDFEQRGTANGAAIVQKGASNNVRNVTQQGGGAVTGYTNLLAVEQTGQKGLVGTVIQQNDIGGTFNSATITQSASNNQVLGAGQLGNANTLTISQGVGNDNVVDRTFQQNVDGGQGNDLTISQSGTGNLLSSAAQGNNGGAKNTATVAFNGDNNGKGEFNVNGFGQAYGSGADILQIGTGNELNATFTGGSNTFGFGQVGADNVAYASISGDGNETAISQYGFNNSTDLVTTGNDNDFGAYQEGTNHLIRASVTGRNNTAVTTQFGDHQMASITVNGERNDVAITQSGSFNAAVVGVGTLNGYASGNLANITQNGTANYSNVNQ